MTDPSTTFQALIEENAVLKQRIRELEKSESDRRRAEDELRERNSQLDLALASARMGTWYLDISDDTRYFDDRICELLSIDRTKFRGTREEFSRVLHPDDRQKVRDAMTRTIEQGVPYELEYRIVRPDGRIHYLSTRGMLVRDAAGRPLRVDGVLWDSSDRKRTEEALKESESKFRDLSEKSIVGIYLIQDNLFRYVNSEFARIFGCAIDEIVDKLRPADVIHPEDLPSVLDSLRKRISGEQKSINYRFRIYNSNRQIRHVEVYSSSTVYQGKPAVVGTLLDMTDRKRMEEALKESEERYRSIFENAREGIFQTTPSGRFIRVNPAMARMCGYASPEELMATITDMATQHYADPKQREVFKEAIESRGSVKNFRVETYRKDRSRIWVSINARTVRDEEGRILYYEGTHEDITEQKLMEDKILENERRYRHLVEHSNDIIYTTDIEGNVIYVNPVTERVTGYTVSEILGKQAYKLIRKDFRKPHYEFYMKQLQEQLASTYYEFPIIARDGSEKWLGQQVQIIFDRDKPVGFHATASDITDRLHAEEEHRQRERLGAMIEMAGGVCHEMNQPLQVISGLAELIMMRTPEDHPLYPKLGEIKNAAGRMTSITRRLMGITKYESKPYIGDRKIIDIDKSSH